MKKSILLSLLIIAAAGIVCLKKHDEHVRLKVEYETVVREAEALGIRVGEEGSAAAGVLKREARDREAEAKALAAEVISFARRMKEIEESGGSADDEMRKETMEVLRRLLDLDATQMKVLIAELKASPELDDETRRGFVAFSIMMLSNDSPELALTIHAESSDILGDDTMGEHVISMALSRLAEKDPFAALDWIRQNGESDPDLVTDLAKSAVVAGAARQDPVMAIGLIRELGLEDHHQAVNGIARSADTPEARLRLVETLRGMSGDAVSGEVRSELLTNLGSQVAAGGFESSVEWFASAGLSESERREMAAGLSYRATGDETGRWMEWIADELPEDQLSNKAGDLMREWTREDFRAAGDWLNDAEEGPLKVEAVKSYAETVAPYEPEAAAQWAMTLPGGRERDQALRNIHREWKKKDEAAAADFATRHGIE